MSKEEFLVQMQDVLQTETELSMDTVLDGLDGDGVRRRQDDREGGRRKEDSAFHRVFLSCVAKRRLARMIP